MADNNSKYDNAFIKSLEVSKKELKNLKYNQIEAWDSIGHMSLMSELEKVFKISLKTDDVIAFESHKKGKEILKKYKVNIK